MVGHAHFYFDLAAGNHRALPEIEGSDGAVRSLRVVGRSDEEQARSGWQSVEIHVRPVAALEIGEVIDIRRTLGLLREFGGKVVRGAEIGTCERWRCLIEELQRGGGMRGERSKCRDRRVIDADQVESVVGTKGV